jgi:hypothetical protein
MKPTHFSQAPACTLLLSALLAMGAHLRHASVAIVDRDGTARVEQATKAQPFDRRYTDFVYRLILEVMHFLNDTGN